MGSPAQSIHLLRAPQAKPRRSCLLMCVVQVLTVTIPKKAGAGHREGRVLPVA